MSDVLSPISPTLRGQVALITGGGRGIGAATAQALARKGAHVVIASRSAAELDATVLQLRAAGLAASARVLDVADEAAVDAVFSDIAATLGRLDMLVNNAAILLSAPFASMTMADWDRLMAINLRGAVLCARQAFRLMMVQAQLARGQLSHVLPGWAPRPEIIHAVFASRRGLLPAVRALVDFLAQNFAKLG